MDPRHGSKAGTGASAWRGWRRAAPGIAVAVASFAACVAIASLLAFADARRESRATLSALAENIEGRAERVRVDTLAVAARLTASRACDPAMLREIVEEAVYVRELGRVEGNRVVCRAPGDDAAPLDLGPPTRTLENGVRIWAGGSTIWIARGDAAMRIAPYHFVDALLPPHTAALALERESGLVAGATETPPEAVLRVARELPAGIHVTADELVALSRSPDGRLYGAAWRSEAAIDDMAMAALPRFALGGALAGLVVAWLAMRALRHAASLPATLARALDRRGLDLVLQPIVDASGAQARIVGFEAMSRWTLDGGEVIPPGVFMPIAVELGRESDVARCIVARLGAEFATTLRAHPDLYVAINLSAENVADEPLLEDLERELERHGIAPRQIVIELTERLIEAEGLQRGLQGLRERGHKLSIDDFGTGASNASRLAEYAPEIVKIDRSFLLLSDSPGPAASLLPQLVALARHGGARIVVEGVETVGQVERIGAFAPVLGQGYYWHRPMRAAEAAALVDSSAAS